MKRNSKILIIVLITIVCAGIIIAVLFWDTAQNNQDNQSVPVPLPTDVAPLDTESWPTFISEKFGFHVKYPADWQVEELSSYVKMTPKSGLGISGITFEPGYNNSLPSAGAVLTNNNGVMTHEGGVSLVINGRPALRFLQSVTENLLILTSFIKQDKLFFAEWEWFTNETNQPVYESILSTLTFN